MRVSLPELRETCINKTFSLPSIACQHIVEERCVTVPQVKEVKEEVQVCRTEVGEECREAELELPRLACRKGLRGELGKPAMV